MKQENDLIERSKRMEYPLTIGQKGLWLLHQLDALSDSYNMPLTFKFSNTINNNEIEKILAVFMKRHAIMRSTFHDIDGSLIRKVNVAAEIKITEYDVKFLNSHDLQVKVRNLSGVPFNLKSGPLIRAHILNGYQGGKMLLLTIHHLIFDGASLKILCDELELIYQSIIQGHQLSDMKYDYNDFQIWQQLWLESDDARSSRDYWLDKLSGELPQLNLSVDNISSKSKSVRGEFLKFAIPQTIVKRFKQFANDYKCSEYLIWLTAYFTFLSRYTSQKDIIVGTPVMGRPEAQFDDIVGYFVNLIPLRCQLSSCDSFIDVLMQFKSEIYEALMHADYPLAELINALGDSNQRGDQPLFKTSFIWTVTEGLKSKSDGLLGVQVHPLIHESGEQNLSLELLVSNDGIKVLLKYRTNCFSAKSIDRIKHSFINFIDNISVNPACEIQKVAIVNNDDEQHLLHIMNNTQADYADQLCIHQLFEQQVKKNPDRIAVVFEEQSLTYSEFNKKANQLAHYLISKGLETDDFVGLLFERSHTMVIALMAVMKAGGAYLPLDPDYPKGRLEHMIQDGGVSLLLTQQDLLTVIDTANCEQIVLDDSELVNVLQELPLDNPNIDGLTSNHLAYVIYTSGSTGQPKGVMIEHKSVVNLANNIKNLDLNQNKKSWGWVAPLVFDASLQGICALLNGQSLHIISEHDKKDINNIKQLLELDTIGILDCTPTLLQLWLNMGLGASLPDLIIGGEPISVSLWNELVNWQKHYKKRAINVYGPTECCVNSSASDINMTKPNIGHALANYRFYILDDNKELSPPGTIGELYIAGCGLARGYLNQPKLTAERFIQHTFDNNTTERLYKTGDLVRYLDDGNLEFITRVDQQVKVRGFRIELGEIEQQLIAQQLVDSALVTVNQTDEDKKIVAYITSNSSIEESELIDNIRLGLYEKIPDYMIPSTFIILKQFPLTTSGKIDRKSLPAPDATQFSGKYLAPEGEIELMLIAIWSELLKIPQEKISADANFFALGGHSLLVTKLINDINKKIHIEIKYIDIFNYPILSNLSAEIGNKLETDSLIESFAESNNDSVEELEW